MRTIAPPPRAGLRNVADALGDAFALTRPYFASDERRVAWTLLVAIVVLNLVGVYLNVVYTYWYKIAYDALQTKNAGAFWASMFTYRFTAGFPWFVPGFVEFAALTIGVAVYAVYLNQLLEIRWRRWLTIAFVTKWLERRAYYRLSLSAAKGSAVDNPDQRISEDIPDFISGALSLAMSLLSNVVTLFSFTGVLWFIAPPLRLGGVAVPGYLVWTALLYSIIGTVCVHIVGRRLIPLTVTAQRVGADFRFNLVRVRESTEQIALQGGERNETDSLMSRFQAIYVNWRQIMNRTKALNFFTNGFAQIALIFPLVVAAPNYFTGVFTLGVLMQIGQVFGNVQGSLSWIVSAYPDIVTWRATVKRLHDFDAAIAHATSENDGLQVAIGGAAMRTQHLEVRLPDGRRLLHDVTLDLERGAPLVLTGPAGVGKSTLFRVLAGIWPYATGEVQQPAGKLLFLPQRPYLPLGSLKHAVVYPNTIDAVPDDTVRRALVRVGLESLASNLDLVDNWALRLSGGEQQRLAFARALVVGPDWLFLDEALSALDLAGAQLLFAAVRDALPDTQIISIAHHEVLTGLHEREIAVSDFGEAHVAAT